MSREEYVKKTPAERALVHMGTEEDQKAPRHKQLWVLRRQINALHSECDRHIEGAVNAWEKTVALTALYDATPKCSDCSGEGKVMVSDGLDRGVHAEVCTKCEGSGEPQGAA